MVMPTNVGYQRRSSSCDGPRTNVPARLHKAIDHLGACAFVKPVAPFVYDENPRLDRSRLEELFIDPGKLSNLFDLEKKGTPYMFQEPSRGCTVACLEPRPYFRVGGVKTRA